ncbi:hypothetical protein XocBAI20_20625 [Xanthomonas oryzae pv. oryzicola]|nr:hypothetical protein XocBAI20_20625 [Xanthomonas oryzae pv. oryzicola]
MWHAIHREQASACATHSAPSRCHCGSKLAMLRGLGIRRIRPLTNNPATGRALATRTASPHSTTATLGSPLRVTSSGSAVRRRGSTDVTARPDR